MSSRGSCIDVGTRARGKIKKRNKRARGSTDEFYAGCLVLRSEPAKDFLADAQRKSPLPITSISEDRLLRALGLSRAEWHQIGGISSSSVDVRGGSILNEEQLAMIALVRLANDPPPLVGDMQRRTAKRLLRSYPFGLRFSGKNMSPLPSWLSGTQSAALNFSDVDLAAQLHFALFAGSGGYVLKPREMQHLHGSLGSKRSSSERFFSLRADSDVQVASLSNVGSSSVSVIDSGALRSSSLPSIECRASVEEGVSKATKDEAKMGHPDDVPQGGDEGVLARASDEYWPPPRQKLYCYTLDVLSLHLLPKCGEQRPRYDGSRSATHKYAPELSGTSAPPNDRPPSSPRLNISLHPVGGFCSLSNVLPLPENTETKLSSRLIEGNGMNAAFGMKIHCVAAEPHTTFLRVVVTDVGQEVAFETVVLGRLQHGFRVLQLRSGLGTRIECCYLLLKIRVESLQNLWSTPRQLRLQYHQHHNEIFHLNKQSIQDRAALTTAVQDGNERREEIIQLQQEIERMRKNALEGSFSKKSSRARPSGRCESLRSETSLRSERSCEDVAALKDK